MCLKLLVFSPYLLAGLKSLIETFFIEHIFTKVKCKFVERDKRIFFWARKKIHLRKLHILKGTIRINSALHTLSLSLSISFPPFYS